MDTMRESRNQDETRSSRIETTAIIDDRKGALIEEGTATLADALPSPLLKSAVALNELIYIGCEKMECAPIGDDGDFSMVQDKSTFDSLLFDSRTFDSKTIDSRTLDSRTTIETSSMSDANGSASSKTWTENEAQTLASWKSNAQSVTRDPSSAPTNVNLRYDRMKVLPPQYTSPSKTTDSIYSYTPGKIGVSIKYISRSQHARNIDDEETLVKSHQESHVETLLLTTSTETEISEESEKPVEGTSSGSLRSMGRSLRNIIIRPIKHKEIDPVLEIVKEEERNFSDSLKAVDEQQPKSTKTDGDSSSHRFRRMLHLNRKEQQPLAAAESDSSKRSSHSSLKSPEKDRDGSVMSPSSLRTRSILDKSKMSAVKNCSRRIMGRSVGFAPEDCVDKNGDDNDSARRSLKRSIMKKASLIGRFRGRGKEGLPPTPQSKQPLKIDPEACEDDESERALELNSTTSKAIVRSPTHATTSMSDMNSRESKIGKTQTQTQRQTQTTNTSKKKKSFVFLNPSDKGQEIALEDDKYFFHDPAQVHSLLTLPTFDDQQQARQNGTTKQIPIKLDIKL
mmetsp:Transcript_15902/g.43991  ORF Transcript_15902/g.43991 Transcript_15902/m.43991 type:complete len:566 (+) Transcript_15902:82-1779(+)